VAGDLGVLKRTRRDQKTLYAHEARARAVTNGARLNPPGSS